MSPVQAILALIYKRGIFGQPQNGYFQIIGRVRMHRRFLVSTVIALALLFSNSAGLFVAALCSHRESDKNSCETLQVEAEPTHHEMDHTQVDEESVVVSTPQTGEAVAVEKQNGSCSHCAVHSRTSRNTASSQQSNVPQRSGELTITLGVFSIPFDPDLRTAALPSRAHGPPGDAIPRHVLLNIFRI